MQPQGTERTEQGSGTEHRKGTQGREHRTIGKPHFLETFFFSQNKTDGSILLTYTGLWGELEHLKIEFSTELKKNEDQGKESVTL